MMLPLCTVSASIADIVLVSIVASLNVHSLPAAEGRRMKIENYLCSH